MSYSFFLFLFLIHYVESCFRVFGGFFLFKKNTLDLKLTGQKYKHFVNIQASDKKEIQIFLF